MTLTWKGYEHGVNLGGWLSQCDHTRERYDQFITEADIRTIASWGLDHVRVPVDYNLVEDEEGNYLEEGFSRLERTVKWCRDAGLNMVLDLHKTYGYSFDQGEGEEGFFDSEKYQERFCRLWEQFARRLGTHSDMLAFELLNEVTDPACSDTWNRIADRPGRLELPGHGLRPVGRAAEGRGGKTDPAALIRFSDRNACLRIRLPHGEGPGQIMASI